MYVKHMYHIHPDECHRFFQNWKRDLIKITRTPYLFQGEMLDWKKMQNLAGGSKCVEK